MSSITSSITRSVTVQDFCSFRQKVTDLLKSSKSYVFALIYSIDSFLQIIYLKQSTKNISDNCSLEVFKRDSPFHLWDPESPSPYSPENINYTYLANLHQQCIHAYIHTKVFCTQQKLRGDIKDRIRHLNACV